MTKKSTTSKTTKHTRKKATKRERLTRAAAECFRECGIRATTIKLIAERADVPIGNVYYYFKTKEDFASAVVASAVESAAAERARWNEMEPKEALIAYVRASLSSPAALSRHGGKLESLVRDLARESSPALAPARDLLMAEERFVRRNLGRLEGDQAESPERAERIAQWLVSAVRGARSQAQLTGDAHLVSAQRQEILVRLKARLGRDSRRTK